jgi:cytochrome c biogenesis protein
MKVVEGETSDTIILKGSSQQKQLDFSIRCDEFEVSFYQGSQRPKDFKSSLTIIEKGNDVLTKVIEVNDPLYYRGVYIYQSSYGTSPDQGEVLLGVEQKSGEKKAREYKAKIGERIALEQQGYEVEAKRFVPDFTIGKNKEVVSRSQELNNPAVQVALLKDGTLQDEQWIFLKFPDFHGAKDAEYRFTFLDFSGKEFTGLQLTKDPGVWVVWVGCILLTLGCYFVFFTSHRRLWVKVEEKKGEYLIIIAGTSNKNLESFSQVFDQIQHECKQLGKTAS